MTISSVLVPLDGSETSRCVLRPVQRLAHANCHVTLMRVIGPGDHEDWLRLREARQTLLKMVDRFEEENFHVHMDLVRNPSPAEAILEAIKNSRPDLVAMTTHGRSGVARLFKGSVAEEVLRQTNKPLLICTEHSAQVGAVNSPFHRILVPLDGSEVAGTIVPLVAKIAKRFEAEVILLNVTPEVPAPGSKEEQAQKTCLNHYARRLEREGVTKVSLQSGLGEPAEEILKLVEANRADLVALSTHGRSGFDRARFGSVAEAVLRDCPAPVLVQRGEESA